MLFLAVIATLLSKVLGFVRCTKVDWPNYYNCFKDQYCCEDDQCCDLSDNELPFGAIVGISFGGFFIICIVMIVCIKSGQHAQRGVIHPSNDVGQQSAIVHISPHAEQTNEQTTRIEPDPTRVYQPARVSTSYSRQQPTTTRTIVKPSEPYLPMYGEHSYSNPSPPPSYTSQPIYSPPPTPPHVTLTQRTG